MAWWDEIARLEDEAAPERRKRLAARAGELIDAIALGDYIDSLPKIHVTEDIAHLVPVRVAGWHWNDIVDMEWYWAAELPIAQAVAKKLGVPLIMPKV